MTASRQQKARAAQRPGNHAVTPLITPPKPLTDKQRDRLIRDLAIRAIEIYGPDEAAQKLAVCFDERPLETYRVLATAFRTGADVDDAERERTEQQLLQEIERLRGELGHAAPVIEGERE